MLNDNAHNELRELIPAYALGSLDKGDAQQVRQHLAVCAACRAELAAYEVVVDSLGTAVPWVSEPAALKERLLDHIRAEAAPAVVKPSPSRWASWWQALTARPAAALAACVLLVVVIFAGWQLFGSAPVQFVMSPTEVAPQAAGVISLTAEQEGILTITD
ncbi:MAG: zf-HC2 domain-containing protein, partial [Anaerolineales bacterium]|nr:zf-HC2 domain-containing protein [Anaerolineales bacterium]